MPVTLRPLDATLLPAWLARSRDTYVKDLVAAGQSREEADRLATASMERAFPAGVPNPGHVVFDVVEIDGTPVGYLWLGQDPSDDPGAWWVWDIEIHADKYGRGFGLHTMLLGEAYAQAQGAHTLGLNVFGTNLRARILYESMGYEIVSAKMRKELT